MKWSMDSIRSVHGPEVNVVHSPCKICLSKQIPKKQISVFLVMAGDAESMEKFSRRLVSYI